MMNTTVPCNIVSVSLMTMCSSGTSVARYGSSSIILFITFLRSCSGSVVHTSYSEIFGWLGTSEQSNAGSLLIPINVITCQNLSTYFSKRTVSLLHIIDNLQ